MASLVHQMRERIFGVGEVEVEDISGGGGSPSASMFFLCSSFLMTTLLLRLVRYRTKRRRIVQQPIVSTLPVVPNAHWLFGHLPTLLQARDFRRGQHEVHCAHANESGICTFWFLTTPSCSVLLGRHVRSVLMATSMRTPVSLMKRHGSQFLGRKMLLQLTGSEWKYYRSVVHRAFIPAALSSYQRSIEIVAEKLVTSLSLAIRSRHSYRSSLSSTGSSLDGLQEAALPHGPAAADNSDTESESGSTELSDPAIDMSSNAADDEISGRPSLTTEVLLLMKLAAIDIFAETSLGKDLGCCSSLTLTPVASAFDYLTEDYTRRIKDLIKPASLFYWLPTRSNYRHSRERNVIRNFLQSTVSERRMALEMEKTKNDEDNRSAAADTTRPSPTSERIATPTPTPTPTPTSRGRLSSRRTGKNDNLLTHMIKTVDAEPYHGDSACNGGCPDEALTDVLMTLLFAGYDTTSINLSYSLYLLSQHKEERDICLAEIDAVMDDASRDADGRCQSEDGPVLDVERLQYTKAVVLESLRLYPPAPMTSRSLERDLEIDGHVIPEKTHINIPIWSIHHDERNFPFPDHFLPKRWVEQVPGDGGDGEDVIWANRTGMKDRYRRSSLVSVSSDCGNVSFPPEEVQECTSPDDVPPANLDAFCAFSGGGRSCPGRKIAVQESVTVLAYLLRNFRFETPDGYEIQPVQASFIQKPKDDLPMKISLRRR